MTLRKALAACTAALGLTACGFEDKSIRKEVFSCENGTLSGSVEKDGLGTQTFVVSDYKEMGYKEDGGYRSPYVRIGKGMDEKTLVDQARAFCTTGEYPEKDYKIRLEDDFTLDKFGSEFKCEGVSGNIAIARDDIDDKSVTLRTGHHRLANSETTEYYAKQGYTETKKNIFDYKGAVAEARKHCEAPSVLPKVEPSTP